MRNDQLRLWFKANEAKIVRGISISSIVLSVVFMMSSVFGIAGRMILVILDAFFGARLTPTTPYLPWALAGALMGVGPALWSFPLFRKRKLAVLFVPIAIILVVGAFSFRK